MTTPAKRSVLARLRRRAGHTQGSLAERLGVDRSTVARWESASAVPVPTLRPALAGVLDISLPELDVVLRDSETPRSGPHSRAEARDVLSGAGSGVPESAVRPRTTFARRRRLAGYTQDTLALELGVARSTVTRWERGLAAPLLSQRRRLAMALRLSLPELLTVLNAEEGTGAETTHTEIVSRPSVR